MAGRCRSGGLGARDIWRIFDPSFDPVRDPLVIAPTVDERDWNCSSRSSPRPLIRGV